MVSKNFFSLSTARKQKYSGGSITNVTADDVSGFVNIAFSELRLNKNGSLEPIWHPNANKIGYCLQGDALVTIRSPSVADTFTVSTGDVFFIPQGFIHHIENMGDQECVIDFTFNHSRPETMNLSNAVYSLSDSVFTATFEAPAPFLKGLKAAKKPELISLLSTKSSVGKTKSNAHKFNIASSNKPIKTKGGYLQLATKGNLPILDGLSILGFGLTPGGIVEPHWHTNAGELVYIVKGQTRITVLAPDGKVEILEVGAGQGAFAAASHFHNIENVGMEDVEVIAYFSHAEPDYIGLGEVVGSYSNELLANTFNVAPNYFDSLIKHETPLVIVPL
jgi:oxalate decarboxylase